MKLSKDDLEQILEMMLSREDLKKMLTETELPATIERAKKSLDLPPTPPIPKDVPQDFQEALFSEGPCAIPLWSDDKCKWRFAIFISGSQIIDSRTDKSVMFDSYEEAIYQVREYFEYMKEKKKDES